MASYPDAAQQDFAVSLHKCHICIDRDGRCSYLVVSFPISEDRKDIPPVFLLHFLPVWRHSEKLCTCTHAAVPDIKCLLFMIFLYAIGNNFFLLQSGFTFRKFFNCYIQALVMSNLKTILDTSLSPDTSIPCHRHY